MKGGGGEEEGGGLIYMHMQKLISSLASTFSNFKKVFFCFGLGF